MRLWIWIKGLLRRGKHRAERDERIARLEINERRVTELKIKSDRILSDNHLGPAIRRALEGR